ncbi:hypothetical protein JB92DRAFT_3098293 [Gautieria morchelliformis]|nr:hypothetical protein JB92DRAFT_3098293 [Gautieria morchelliformis]
MPPQAKGWASASKQRADDLSDAVRCVGQAHEKETGLSWGRRAGHSSQFGSAKENNPPTPTLRSVNLTWANPPHRHAVLDMLYHPHRTNLTPEPGLSEQNPESECGRDPNPASYDPDIGEIVVVRKKNRRVGRDWVVWRGGASNGGACSGVPDEVNNRASRGAGSRAGSRVGTCPTATAVEMKDAKEKYKLKPDDKDIEKWWSIGKGRKESLSRVNEASVGTGMVMHIKELHWNQRLVAASCTPSTALSHDLKALTRRTNRCAVEKPWDHGNSMPRKTRPTEQERQVFYGDHLQVYATAFGNVMLTSAHQADPPHYSCPRAYHISISLSLVLSRRRTTIPPSCTSRYNLAATMSYMRFINQCGR